ncbi:MAG: hypothetical protein CBC33_000645 [Coraliomargarita sp. TMED73]|nr:MAG: hypothetical protein CBC33_000645 [Coraliomargarita sp. TMED73]
MLPGTRHALHPAQQLGAGRSIAIRQEIAPVRNPLVAGRVAFLAPDHAQTGAVLEVIGKALNLGPGRQYQKTRPQKQGGEGGTPDVAEQMLKGEGERNL